MKTLTVFLCCSVCVGLPIAAPGGENAPVITAFGNGQIEWTNVDPSLYYTVEWLPRLSDTNWTGSYRGLQDLQSFESTITADVPMFLRIVGSSTPLHTYSLSATSAVVSAGYYAATNLANVDPDLAPGNVAGGVSLFGVTGTALIATGNAAASEVLAGRTFSTLAESGLTGSMPELGGVTITPGTAQQVISQGYHDGSGFVEGDADLVSANVRAGIHIFGVTGSPAVVDTSSGNATATGLLAGSKAWVNGSEVTGTMPTALLSDSTVLVPAGYYEATNLSQVDQDLAAANIRSTVSLFGVNGKAEVVDTTSGDASAGDILIGKKAWVDGAEVTGARAPVPVPKTGQVNTFRTGDDGDLERGTAWPSPRFTTQSDTNVVLDNLTGLMWARNANLDGTKDWPGAIDYCEALNHGGYTDWRLPNVRELHSLIDFGRFNPALPAGHPFGNAQGDYWTSTMLADPSGDAWFVRLTDGYVDVSGTTAANYVWPVRGGD